MEVLYHFSGHILWEYSHPSQIYLQPGGRFARKELCHCFQQRLNNPCSSRPILRCLEHLCLRNGSQAPLSDGWGDAPTLNMFSADLRWNSMDVDSEQQHIVEMYTSKSNILNIW